MFTIEAADLDRIAAPLGLAILWQTFPGLRQPWALRRNRFAVAALDPSWRTLDSRLIQCIGDLMALQSSRSPSQSHINAFAGIMWPLTFFKT